LLILPVIILLYITASPQQHAKRLRRQGRTYKQIAQQLKNEPYNSEALGFGIRC